MVWGYIIVLIISFCCGAMLQGNADEKQAIKHHAARYVNNGQTPGNEMSNRQQLMRHMFEQDFTKGMTAAHYNGMVDFIIADRKRIVEPLVKALEDSAEASDTFEEHDIVQKGIDETISRSGGG